MSSAVLEHVSEIALAVFWQGGDGSVEASEPQRLEVAGSRARTLHLHQGGDSAVGRA